MKKKNGFISMTLVYTFLILFMFLMLAILRTYTEKDKFLQAINDQIDNDIGIAKGSRVTVINRLLEDNMPISDTNIHYFKISNSHYGNGNALYYMDKKDISGYKVSDLTDENADGYSSRIYYFRGKIETNHLIFAGLCFRIIRTNEDGSIRLRYNGVAINNACPTLDEVAETPGLVSIGSAKFNEDSSVEYVKTINGSVPQADSDNAQSPIVELLNEWYKDHFVPKQGDSVNYTDYISKSTIFCNNKVLLEDGVNYESKDLVPSFIDNSSHNIYNDSNVKSIVKLKCSSKNDRFSIKDNTLIYPVGLVTAQDMVLSGGYLSTSDDLYNGGVDGVVENSDYYMFTGSNYWTMSPYSSDGKMIYVSSDGSLQIADPTEEFQIIPVISLNSNIVISRGNGTSESPFIVQ